MQIQALQPDGTTKPVDVPNNVWIIPPSAQFPGFQINVIGAEQSIYSHIDAQALAQYNAQVDSWLANAKRNQEFGVPPAKWQPKPIQPISHSVNVVMDEAGDAYLWISDGYPLGTPCPDPPPLPQIGPAGQIDIGKHNWGLYWAAGPNNNPPQNVYEGQVVSGTSADGVTGSWQFINSIGSTPQRPLGWYLKVG